MVPAIVDAGSTIQVGGHGFSSTAAENEVTINGHAASVLTAAPDQLDVRVPLGATSGPLAVRSPLGGATSAGDVVVATAPFHAADVVFAGRLVAGVAATATVATAGKVALLTLAEPAGGRVSLSLASSTFSGASPAATIAVYGPDGSTVLAPTGFDAPGLFVDTVTAKVAGTYTVLVDPQGEATGQVSVVAHDVGADIAESTTPGGAPVTVATAVPGQNAVVSFPGSAGQRVSLGLTASTFGSQSAKITVRAPDGSVVAAETSFSDAGTFVGPLVLGATGTYTALIDPVGEATGQVVVQVYNVAADQASTGEIGGAPVTVDIESPGQVGRVSFTGTVGQLVYIAVSNSTFAPGDVDLSLVDPRGLLSPSGATFGASAFLGPIELPDDGAYTVVLNLDPPKRYGGEC